MKSTNQVSLYKKIDDELARKVNIEVSTPQFFYKNNEGLKYIQLKDEFDGVLTINEFDIEWAPDENELSIRQNFTFKNPSLLFGVEGVTMGSNKIGLAVHIHSKGTSIQKKIKFGTVTNSLSPIDVYFEYKFPRDSLRGTIEMDFFTFLEESNDTHFSHAKGVGMRLNEEDLYNLVIVVDGEGSAFPITEFKEKEGPLWKLEKKWVDASEDAFDISNVSVCLNIVHPLFEQIKAGKTKVSRAMMGDIMVQSMAMIIHQVINIEKLTLDMVRDIYTGSILEVVKYWVETNEVETDSIFTIMNTLRRNLEKRIQGGDLD